MKKSILKTMSLLLFTAMMAIIMLPQAAFAATDYTCYIGSNGYSTLAEAVEAANAGDTIWMTANDSVSTTFDVDKNLTIELEGYTLANACMRFVGDITVNINDRAGTAKINTNQNSGFKVTDYEYDSRVRGGAVFNEGILHISGAPVIKDNFVNETPNNIYLLMLHLMKLYAL